MKRCLVVFVIICAGLFNNSYSQSVIVSVKAGFVYPAGSLESEIGGIGTVSVENKFNKYFSLGLNGKFGGADYEDDKTYLEDGLITEERELDIFNSTFAVNVFSKIFFINTEELLIGIVPEIGYYWNNSHPTIYFTDKQLGEVTHQSYSNTSTKEIGYGLHLEGQYYLGDRTSIIASVGWNNYDTGKSMNKLDLENNWDKELDEKIDFLYFEIGICYSLFGKDLWE
jgi:hypothetical protein